MCGGEAGKCCKCGCDISKGIIKSITYCIMGNDREVLELCHPCFEIFYARQAHANAEQKKELDDELMEMTKKKRRINDKRAER